MSSSLQLGDADVITGSIMMPRVGLWTADLMLDTATVPSGTTSLRSSDGMFSMTGWVLHAGVYSGHVQARVVGGSGGLRLTAGAVYYRSVPARIPLMSLLSELGESLSSTSDPTPLNSQLVLWSRRAEPGGIALGRLVDAIGASWRALDDGSIWVGQDTYPTVDLGDTYETLHLAPSEDHATVVGPQVPAALRPGTTFLGRRVAFVEHVVGAADVRSTVWYERAGSSQERALAALQALARGAVRTEYLGLYPGVVTAQGQSGELEITLDDARFPPLTDVPLARFAPGIEVSVFTGSRVLVGFAGGDPQAPVALLWLDGSTVEVPVADCGTLTGTAPSSGGPVTFTYTPPGGVPITSQTIDLKGRIRS